MNGAPQRRVTRGYVWGVIAAVVILAMALVVAAWGLLGLGIGRPPVTTPGVGRFAAELILGLLLALLAWALWTQALSHLRGRRAPSWSAIIVLAGGAYLGWCALGTVFGMSLSDTWSSPFALMLALIWGLCPLIFWAVLVRRIFTDRPVPQWPWERRTGEGPDWANGADDGDDDAEGMTR